MSFARSAHISARAVAVLSGMFVAILMVPERASAAELVVSPKNEKTLTRSLEGNFTPRKLKYRLSATGGKKAKWQLKAYPKWLVAEPTKGTAVSKKQTVVFTPSAKKIGRLKPGYYAKKIQFSYTHKKKAKVIRRNVLLLVEGDPDVGKDLFLARCSGCHDLNTNMSGPFLRNVYGRKAGTTYGFNHSEALRAYGKIWEESNLNDWLINPQKLAPKAKMYVRVKNPADRMNLIAYLKSVSQ